MSNKVQPYDVIVNDKNSDDLIEGLIDSQKNQVNLTIPIGSPKPVSKIESQLEFIWKDIKISTKNVKNFFSKQETPKKVILDNISGKVKSGEALAIIGSSGAGKTTLLNFLSKKIESSNLDFEGQITLNSQPINQKLFDKISSYVMQDDVLEGSMTPLEILLFNAKLKLNDSAENIEEKVRKMIFDLNLRNCQHTRIGNSIERGVSGGERKRTSIGVELISNPKIVFLDEPTTGLDSFNAFEVLTLLRKLSSEEGRIVIFTIHQPSSELFELLDKICILALGKNLYFGGKDQSIDMFRFNGLLIPPNYNPFEFFIEVSNYTCIEDQKILDKYPELKEQVDLQERYRIYINKLAHNFQQNKHIYTNEEATVTNFSEELNEELNKKLKESNFCKELIMLIARNIIITLRNKSFLFSKLIQMLFTSILIGILWQNMSMLQSGIQDRKGMIFLIITNAVFGQVSHTILTFSDERSVFLRERSTRLYSVLSYYMAKTFTELPIAFIIASLFMVIIYYICGLNDIYSTKFINSILLTFYLNILGLSWGFFLGTLAKNKEVLVALGPAVTAPLSVLNGFFVNSDSLAFYLRPFQYISPFKYGYEVMMHNEFMNRKPFYCSNSHDPSCHDDYIINFDDQFNLSLYLIGALIICLKTAAFLMLYFFAKIKS